MRAVLMQGSIINVFRFRREAFIVWMRNVRVWRKLAGPSLVLHFGEPLIYLLGLGYGLGTLVGNVNDIPYLTFFASGLVASSAMSTATLEGTYSAYTRMATQQTYQSILNTPIQIEDIMMGELLWCATKATMSGIAILIVAALLGAVKSAWAVAAIPVIFLSGLCFSAPALLISTAARSYDFFNYYFTIGVTPMFILCGVFFPISTLPDWLQSFVMLLPLTHAVSLVRPLITGETVAAPLLHIAVLIAYTGVFYLLAATAARRRFLV